MLRKHRKTAGWAIALLGLAGLALLTSCNVASTGTGTGRVNILVTDGPTDDWEELTVTLKSVTLRNAITHAWTDNILNANTPTTLNLVDLTGVSTLLGKATISEGSYDRLKITVDTTQPITLKAANETAIDPANIVLANPEIKVTLSPPTIVAADGTATVSVDFDLSHPLSIIVQNDKVVINIVARHKALPRNLFDIQFARTLGTVTEDPATTTEFKVTPVSGADVTFGVDAATIYVNVDDPNVTPGFDGLKKGVGVLVASNMKADGTFYARKVWYGAVDKLPQFTPEGLVRRVGDNWIKVYNKNAVQTSSEHYDCHWYSDLIYVQSDTQWTFQGTTIGQGTSFLHNIRRGFRVSVTFKTDYPRVAATIDIQSAHDEGIIRSVTATGFTFSGDDYGSCWYNEHWRSNQWAYSAVQDHLFKWWFYGEAVPAATLPDGTTPDPTAAGTLAAVIQNFVDTVTEAKNANLRAFAYVELTWDVNLNKWVAEDVVLAPEKLPDPAHITIGYTEASGSIVVGTFDWDNPTMPTVLEVKLDSSSDLQTIVGSLLWSSKTSTLTLRVPVDPTEWKDYLTPALLGVRVWVRPIKSTADGSFSWTAYAVLGFQVATN
jgi:Domain of unknown function (DUF4382)